MVVLRVSGVLVVVLLATKAALFVADDAKFVDARSLEALEKRIGKLLDEALRHRQEAREREEESCLIRLAHRLTAVRRTIMRGAQELRQRAREALASRGRVFRGAALAATSAHGVLDLPEAFSGTKNPSASQGAGLRVKPAHWA